MNATGAEKKLEIANLDHFAFGIFQQACSR